MASDRAGLCCTVLSASQLSLCWHSSYGTRDQLRLNHIGIHFQRSMPKTCESVPGYLPARRQAAYRLASVHGQMEAFLLLIHRGKLLRTCALTFSKKLYAHFLCVNPSYNTRNYRRFYVKWTQTKVTGEKEASVEKII